MNAKEQMFGSFENKKLLHFVGSIKHIPAHSFAALTSEVKFLQKKDKIIIFKSHVTVAYWYVIWLRLWQSKIKS